MAHLRCSVTQWNDKRQTRSLLSKEEAYNFTLSQLIWKQKLKRPTEMFHCFGNSPQNIELLHRNADLQAHSKSCVLQLSTELTVDIKVTLVIYYMNTRQSYWSHFYRIKRFVIHINTLVFIPLLANLTFFVTFKNFQLKSGGGMYVILKIQCTGISSWTLQW